MSDASETRAMKRWQQQLDQMRNDGTWSADELDFLLSNPENRSASDYIQAGNTLELPQGGDMWQFLNSLGVASGASPDKMMGLQEFMAQNGLTLPEYQAQYGGLPLSFSADGTSATYDPSYVKNAYTYDPGPDWFETVIPGLILGMGAAGLGGFLPGTESVFGGAANAAGAGAAGAGEFGASFAPTITPSTVAQSGLLYTGGSMPTVAGLSGVGGLTAEGMAALGTMGSAGAGLGAGTTGALGSLGLDAAGNIVSQGLNLANGGTAAGLGSTVTGAAGGGGGAGGALQGASTASTLSKLLSGDASLDDYLKLGGTIGSGLLGAYSSNQQADAIRDESARLDAIQAPWRGRLSDMYANPAGFLESAPVKASIDQGTQAVSRALSTQYGNPALAPNAMAEISKYANNSLYSQFGNEANRLAAFGGLNFPATASSGLNTQAAQADNGVYDALGYTLGQLTAPKQMTVADMIKSLQSGNIFGSTVGV